MALTERLALIVDLNGATAVRELQKVGNAAERELGKAEARSAKFGRAFSAAGVGMMGAGALLTGVMYKSAQAAEEANVAHLKLENTMKSAPNLAGASTKAFEAQSKAIQNLTVADDESVISAQSLLGQFGLTQSKILEITPLVVDLSRKMGVDMDTAAKMVGKSVEGSSTALKKAGIVVDEAAFANDHYGATVEALRTKVGGFAESEGKTFSGQMAILKNQLADVQEGIGVGAVSAISKMVAPLQSASHWFTELDESTQSTIGTFGAFGGAGLLATGALSTLIGQAIKAKEHFGKLSVSLKGLDFSKVVQGGAMAGIAAGSAIAAKNVQDMEQGMQDLMKSSAWAGLDSKTGSIDKINERLGKMDGELKSLDSQANDMSSGWQKFNFIERFIEGNNIDNARSEMRSSGKEMNDLKLRAQELSQATGESADVTLRFMLKQKESGEATGNAAVNAEKFAEAQAEAAEDTRTLTERLTDAERATTSYFDNLTGRMDAEIGWESALDGLQSALAENGATLDIHTEKGRNNIAALREGADAALQRGLKIAEETGSTGQGIAATEQMIAQLRREMEVRGLSKVEIDKYIASLHLTPAEINTAFTTSGVQEALNAANAVRDVLNLMNNAADKAASSAARMFAPRATGGPMSSGGSYLVGESGPELVTGGGGGWVRPATASMGAQSSQPLEVNVQLDGRTIATAMVDHMSRMAGAVA